MLICKSSFQDFFFSEHSVCTSVTTECVDDHKFLGGKTPSYNLACFASLTFQTFENLKKYRSGALSASTKRNQLKREYGNKRHKITIAFFGSQTCSNYFFANELHAKFFITQFLWVETLFQAFVHL